MRHTWLRSLIPHPVPWAQLGNISMFRLGNKTWVPLKVAFFIFKSRPKFKYWIFVLQSMLELPWGKKTSKDQVTLNCYFQKSGERGGIHCVLSDVLCLPGVTAPSLAPSHTAESPPLWASSISSYSGDFGPVTHGKGHPSNFTKGSWHKRKHRRSLSLRWGGLLLHCAMVRLSVEVGDLRQTQDQLQPHSTLSGILSYFWISSDEKAETEGHGVTHPGN